MYRVSSVSKNKTLFLPRCKQFSVINPVANGPPWRICNFRNSVLFSEADRLGTQWQIKPKSHWCHHGWLIHESILGWWGECAKRLSGIHEMGHSVHLIIKILLCWGQSLVNIHMGYKYSHLFPHSEKYSVQFSSVAQSCLTLCNPMNHSTPGLPVHHQLPEFTQTHVHWVGDAIQPSHLLSSPSPLAPNPSQHQCVNSSHEVAKALIFQLQHQSFQWTPRTDLL